MLYRKIDACRSCGDSRLTRVLDLGDLAISDFLASPDDFRDVAPIVLVRCAQCTLVQLEHSVERDRLYKQYWYASGTQPSMVSSLQEVVDQALSIVRLEAGDTVCDIGANDGTLLRMYPAGVQKVAYEPADNLLETLQMAECREIHRYYPDDSFPLRAKIITSLACFYDVEDPNAFVAKIKEDLAVGGVWLNQLSYLPATLASANFGDFCHEHLCYWDLTSMTHLMSRHGLKWSASFNDVNGGSFRIVARHGKPRSSEWKPTVGWRRLRREMAIQRTAVREYLQKARRLGHTVIGYGASTKGNTYLQYWGVTPDLMEYIADRNPAKWGLFAPTGQQVISEELARSMRPEAFLVLPWHFLDAFIERESDYLSDGGKLAVPFPTFREIGAPEATLHAVAGTSVAGSLLD